MPADSLDEHGLPHWPAAERNKQPILEQLARLLPPAGGTLLEIAAGTGQHAAHFAAALPAYQFQPTDYDPEHLDTLERRARTLQVKNLLAPLRLDVTEDEWPVQTVDVIYCANMVHIAPWDVAVGLFRGAGRVLGPSGLLITYGPYQINGVHTSESNEQFDASLRQRNPSWGVRDLSALGELGRENSFVPREPVLMPANNFLVVWDRV